MLNDCVSIVLFFSYSSWKLKTKAPIDTNRRLSHRYTMNCFIIIYFTSADSVSFTSRTFHFCVCVCICSFVMREIINASLCAANGQKMDWQGWNIVIINFVVGLFADKRTKYSVAHDCISFGYVISLIVTHNP